MNSSDEAALRFTLVNAMVCYLAKGREPKMEDAPAAAVEATAAVDAFAAAVRAEAVADERRRIMWRLEDAEIANLELVSDEAYHLLKSIIFPSLAAGPVLVATPPAEPADDEDETPTGKVTRSEAEALRTKAAPIDLLASLQANLPPAPSQPVTCGPTLVERCRPGMPDWPNPCHIHGRTAERRDR